MTDLDLLIGRTQRNLTYVYWLLFSGVLAALIFIPRPLDDSTKTLLITFAGILGTLVTMQNQFWFARARAAGVPDPSTTTVSTPAGPESGSTVSVAVTPAPGAAPPAPLPHGDAG